MPNPKPKQGTATKANSNYSVGTDDHRCQQCAYFTPNDGCDILTDKPVDKNYSCVHFNRVPL